MLVNIFTQFSACLLTHTSGSVLEQGVLQISKKAGVGEVLLYTDNPATHPGRLRRRVVLWGRMWGTGPQDQTAWFGPSSTTSLAV